MVALAEASELKAELEQGGARGGAPLLDDAPHVPRLCIGSCHSYMFTIRSCMSGKRPCSLPSSARARQGQCKRTGMELSSVMMQRVYRLPLVHMHVVLRTY